MDGGLRKLKSEDGVVFEIEENCLLMSNFLKDLVNDYPDPDEEIIINQVNSKNLKQIVDYLKHYEKEKPKQIPKPLPDGDLKKYLDEWDYNLINPLCYKAMQGFWVVYNALSTDKIIQGTRYA